MAKALYNYRRYYQSCILALSELFPGETIQNLTPFLFGPDEASQEKKIKYVHYNSPRQEETEFI